MLDLKESQTRKLKIDVLLLEQGWNVETGQKLFSKLILNNLILKNKIISRLMRLAETMPKANMQIICC